MGIRCDRGPFWQPHRPHDQLTSPVVLGWCRIDSGLGAALTRVPAASRVNSHHQGIPKFLAIASITIWYMKYVFKIILSNVTITFSKNSTNPVKYRWKSYNQNDATRQVREPPFNHYFQADQFLTILTTFCKACFQWTCCKDSFFSKIVQDWIIIFCSQNSIYI